MALSITDYAIIKVVQTSHDECEIRYGISSGIQCSRGIHVCLSSQV